MMMMMINKCYIMLNYHYPQKDNFLIHNAILNRLTGVRYFKIIVL